MNPAFRPIYVCLFFGLTVSLCDGGLLLQHPSAEHILNKANAYFEEGLYDSALYSYQHAEKLYSANKDWAAVTSCKNASAEIFRILGDNVACQNLIDGSLTIIREHLQGNNESIAKVYEIQGKLFDYNLREFDKALQYYERSYAIRKALHQKAHASIAESLFLIGRVYLNTGKFALADQHLKDATAIRINFAGEDDIGLYETYMSRAVLYRRLLRFDDALVFYKKAEDVWRKNKRSEQHPNFAMLSYGMGNLYIESGLYSDAIERYSKALAIFIISYGKEDYRVAATYSNIGAALSNQLKFYETIQYYNKALTIYQSVGDEDHPFISSLYVDFCDVYLKMGKYSEAIDFGKKAIALLEKRFSNEPARELGIACMYTSHALLKSNHPAAALELVNKAIRSLEPLEEKYLLSNAYTIRAQIAAMQKDAGQAEVNFNLAMKVYDSDNIARNLHLAFTSGAFAAFKNEQKKFAEALRIANLGLYHAGLDTLDGYNIRIPEVLYTLDFLADLLPHRGESLWELYQLSREQKLLVSALENYKFLVQVYQKVIQESKAERSKLHQLPNLAVYYEKAVACALALYERNNDAQYLYQAFSFAEQSRSILLWQYVHDTKAKQFAGIPSDVLKEEHRVKEKLSFVEKRLTEFSEAQISQQDSLFVATQNGYFNLRSKYDSLLQQLEKNYPAYHAMKYKRTSIGAHEVMAILNDNDAVIEYLVGEDKIYAFVLTQRSLDIITINNRLVIEDQAISVREALRQKDIALYSREAFKFYQQIFQPLEPLLEKYRVSNLTIIPDGFLSYVPMEALIKQPSSTGEHRYLIHDYTFHYQFSAGLIAEYRSIRSFEKDGSLIAFAPSFNNPVSAKKESGVDVIASLPFARQEVEHITAQFNGTSYLDDFATESNFKKYAGTFNIVHIATHAVMDAEDADQSRLYFAVQNDSTDDGRLYAYEVFNLDLPASLVTLSACNTGSGKLQRGEGLMSMSRAFAYAGCPSIVTSMWPAQDNTTALIMKSFYENLASGNNKAEALRQAKLEYLETADKLKSNPFFWAGFILVGDEMPVEKPFESKWILIAVLLIAVAGFVFWKIVKNRSASN